MARYFVRTTPPGCGAFGNVLETRPSCLLSRMPGTGCRRHHHHPPPNAAGKVSRLVDFVPNSDWVYWGIERLTTPLRHELCGFGVSECRIETPSRRLAAIVTNRRRRSNAAPGCYAAPVGARLAKSTRSRQLAGPGANWAALPQAGGIWTSASHHCRPTSGLDSHLPSGSWYDVCLSYGPSGIRCVKTTGRRWRSVVTYNRKTNAGQRDAVVRRCDEGGPSGDSFYTGADWGNRG